jgi:hypothetical protein
MTQQYLPIRSKEIFDIKAMPIFLKGENIMKRLMVVCFFCFLTLSIIGCDKIKSFFGGGKDIDLVKEGILTPFEESSIANMKYDKSMTIGQAIDNYGAFKNTKWKVVTAKNGTKVVQVIGYNDNLILNCGINGVKESFAQYQFQVNPDKTIRLAWCGYGAYKDGSKIEPLETANVDSCMFDLMKIYNNEAFPFCRYISDVISPSNSEYIKIINSACKNAYTAAVAHTVDHPNPTNITLPDLINAGYQPTEGVTITTDNLSDKGGTITCSSSDTWKVSPAVVTVDNNGFMRITMAKVMSSSMQAP